MVILKYNIADMVEGGREGREGGEGGRGRSSRGPTESQPSPTNRHLEEEGVPPHAHTCIV